MDKRFNKSSNFYWINVSFGFNCIRYVRLEEEGEDEEEEATFGFAALYKYHNSCQANGRDDSIC